MSSLLKIDPYERLKLDEQGSISPKSSLNSPKAIPKVPPKAHVDFSTGNDRNRRDLFSVFNNQDAEFDNHNTNNLYTNTINNLPPSDNELEKIKKSMTH